MTTYRFPFEIVRLVKSLARDEERLRLADAYRALEIVQQRQQQLNGELAMLHDQQREEMSRQALNVNNLLAAQRYKLVLKAEQEALEKNSAMMAEEVERRRQLVVEAEQGFQIMERLDSRLRTSHHSKEQRAETKQLDETAQQRALARRG